MTAQVTHIRGVSVHLILMKRVVHGVWIAVVTLALALGFLLLSEMAGLNLAAKAE